MNIEKILLDNSPTPTRREFLKTSGMLIVGVSAAPSPAHLQGRRARRRHARVSIPIRTTTSSIHGS